MLWRKKVSLDKVGHAVAGAYLEWIAEISLPSPVLWWVSEALCGLSRQCKDRMQLSTQSHGKGTPLMCRDDTNKVAHTSMKFVSWFIEDQTSWLTRGKSYSTWLKLMPSLRGTGWGVEAQNRHHHHHQHWSNGTMINLGAQVLVSTQRPVHYYFHSKTWSSWSKPNLQSPISTEADIHRSRANLQSWIWWPRNILVTEHRADI